MVTGPHGEHGPGVLKLVVVGFSRAHERAQTHLRPMVERTVAAMVWKRWSVTQTAARVSSNIS